MWNDKSRPRPPLSDRSYGVSMIDFKKMSIRSILGGRIVDILFWSLVFGSYDLYSKGILGYIYKDFLPFGRQLSYEAYKVNESLSKSKVPQM